MHRRYTSIAPSVYKRRLKSNAMSYLDIFKIVAKESKLRLKAIGRQFLPKGSSYEEQR